MQDQSRKDSAKMLLDSLRHELALVTAELQKTSDEFATASSELESIKYNRSMATSLQNEMQYFRAEVSSMQNVRIKFESDMQSLHSKISLVSSELSKAKDALHDVGMEAETLISQIRSVDVR